MLWSERMTTPAVFKRKLGFSDGYTRKWSTSKKRLFNFNKTKLVPNVRGPDDKLYCYFEPINTLIENFGQKLSMMECGCVVVPSGLIYDAWWGLWTEFHDREMLAVFGIGKQTGTVEPWHPLRWQMNSSIRQIENVSQTNARKKRLKERNANYRTLKFRPQRPGPRNCFYWKIVVWL